METARITYGDKTYEAQVITGTENEKAIDISNLRKETGLITLDPGYQNTGSCTSAITFIDGEQGILRYRGIPVEVLAEKSRFVEVAYLLIYGKLPNLAEINTFSGLLNVNSMIHEDMLHLLDQIPRGAHPMAVLGTLVGALPIYYPGLFVDDADADAQTFDRMAAGLISKIRTMAAFSYKKMIGEPLVYPRSDLKYSANLLNMMFSSPVKPHDYDPEIARLLDILLILHADHEQNCSTSTVRLVGSSKVNLYSSICAGIYALWGPLHGGANQEVIEMLESIHKSNLTAKQCVELAKSKDSKFRLMGFGHRVYRSYDPRARLLRELCHQIFEHRKIEDPLLNIALELEELALKDTFFIERKLYPNVDFYSGILYRFMGLPTDFFTVMFAIGRMPGWIAQWKEMHETVPFRIGRPRQIYTGEVNQPYVPMNERK